MNDTYRFQDDSGTRITVEREPGGGFDVTMEGKHRVEMVRLPEGEKLARCLLPSWDGTGPIPDGPVIVDGELYERLRGAEEAEHGREHDPEGEAQAAFDAAAESGAAGPWAGNERAYIEHYYPDGVGLVVDAERKRIASWLTHGEGLGRLSEEEAHILALAGEMVEDGSYAVESEPTGAQIEASIPAPPYPWPPTPGAPTPAACHDEPDGPFGDASCGCPSPAEPEQRPLGRLALRVREGCHGRKGHEAVLPGVTVADLYHLADAFLGYDPDPVMDGPDEIEPTKGREALRCPCCRRENSITVDERLCSACGARWSEGVGDA